MKLSKSTKIAKICEMILKLTIEYNGVGFAGYQLQPKLRTVEGLLGEAILKIAGEKPTLSCASRTDSGVHALGNVVSYGTELSPDPYKYRWGLNSVLPDDLVVTGVEKAPDHFDARASAKARVYNYLILNRPYPSTRMGQFSYFYHPELSLVNMRKAAKYLMGEQDFTSFTPTAMEHVRMVRDLKRIDISKDKDFIVIETEADSYLRNMVRIIVGTLIEVGRGLKRSRDMKGILKAKDRRAAGFTAPPHGLTLVKVVY